MLVQRMCKGRSSWSHLCRSTSCFRKTCRKLLFVDLLRSAFRLWLGQQLFRELNPHSSKAAQEGKNAHENNVFRYLHVCERACGPAVLSGMQTGASPHQETVCCEGDTLSLSMLKRVKVWVAFATGPWQTAPKACDAQPTVGHIVCCSTGCE